MSLLVIDTHPFSVFQMTTLQNFPSYTGHTVQVLGTISGPIFVVISRKTGIVVVQNPKWKY